MASGSTKQLYFYENGYQERLENLGHKLIAGELDSDVSSDLAALPITDKQGWQLYYWAVRGSGIAGYEFMLAHNVPCDGLLIYALLEVEELDVFKLMVERGAPVNAGIFAHVIIMVDHPRPLVEWLVSKGHAMVTEDLVAKAMLEDLPSILDYLRENGYAPPARCRLDFDTGGGLERFLPRVKAWCKENLEDWYQEHSGVVMKPAK